MIISFWEAAFHIPCAESNGLILKCGDCPNTQCSLLTSSLSYPENGVVAMKPVDVRPRARTLLKWDQLQVGMRVMVNYNLETPEERGFWFDAEVQTVNQTSRTSKELRVKILLG